jgi:hypothetical protein
MPVTNPGIGASNVGLAGLMKACGAGSKRGRNTHVVRVNICALASTEPSPKMATKPTTPSRSAFKVILPSPSGWSQCILPEDHKGKEFESVNIVKMDSTPRRNAVC